MNLINFWAFYFPLSTVSYLFKPSNFSTEIYSLKQSWMVLLCFTFSYIVLNFSSLVETKRISVHSTTFSRTPSKRELYVPFKFVFSIYFSSKSLSMQLNSFTSYWLFCSLLFHPNAFKSCYVRTGFSSAYSS